MEQKARDDSPIAFSAIALKAVRGSAADAQHKPDIGTDITGGGACPASPYVACHRGRVRDPGLQGARSFHPHRSAQSHASPVRPRRIPDQHRPDRLWKTCRRRSLCSGVQPPAYWGITPTGQGSSPRAATDAAPSGEILAGRPLPPAYRKRGTGFRNRRTSSCARGTIAIRKARARLQEPK